MKYKLTPLNLVSVILLGLIIYLFVKPGPEGWGFLGAYILIFVFIFGLGLDFFLQNLIKEYKNLIIIEIIILFLTFIFYKTQIS